MYYESIHAAHSDRRTRNSESLIFTCCCRCSQLVSRRASAVNHSPSSLSSIIRQLVSRIGQCSATLSAPPPLRQQPVVVSALWLTHQPPVRGAPWSADRSKCLLKVSNWTCSRSQQTFHESVRAPSSAPLNSKLLVCVCVYMSACVCGCVYARVCGFDSPATSLFGADEHAGTLAHGKLRPVCRCLSAYVCVVCVSASAYVRVCV